MNMKKVAAGALALVATGAFAACGEAAVAKIASAHKVVREDVFCGCDRVVFDFNGREAWVAFPKADDVREGRPWVWTMQGATSVVARTVMSPLLADGYHHVSIAIPDGPGIEFDATFQDFLVGTLGLAPQANLMGLDRGGAFAVRYAENHPARVSRICLGGPCPKAKSPGACSLAAGVPVLLAYGFEPGGSTIVEFFNAGLPAPRQLPTVRLLGDSIRMSYQAGVSARLRGKAVVSGPTENCSSTWHWRERMKDAFLENRHWDIIHANVGIHDTAWRRNGSGRTEGGPENYICPERYREFEGDFDMSKPGFPGDFTLEQRDAICRRLGFHVRTTARTMIRPESIGWRMPSRIAFVQS